MVKCEIGHTGAGWMSFVIFPTICHLPLLACKTTYRSSTALVACGQLLLKPWTAVPVIVNALQPHNTMLWAIRYSSATVVTFKLSSNFSMIIYQAKSSRCHLQDCLFDISHWGSNSTSFKLIYTMQYLSQKFLELPTRMLYTFLNFHSTSCCIHSHYCTSP